MLALRQFLCTNWLVLLTSLGLLCAHLTIREPAFAFFAIDEACKALIGLWVALYLASRSRQLLVIVLGIAAFWSLSYIWKVRPLGPFPEGFVERAIANPGDFYFKSIHFLAVVFIALAMRGLMRVRLGRLPHAGMIDWTVQFSLRSMLISVAGIATLLCAVTLLRSEIERSWSGAVIFGVDSLRLALVAIVLVFAMLSSRVPPLRLCLAFAAAFGLTLLVPFAFGLDDAILAWTGYAIIQLFVMMGFLAILRRMGYRLTRSTDIAADT